MGGDATHVGFQSPQFGGTHVHSYEAGVKLFYFLGSVLLLWHSGIHTCVCHREGVLSWAGQVTHGQGLFILGILMRMIDEWKAMKIVSVGGGGGGAPGAPGAFERRRQAAGVGHLHHLHHSHHQQSATPQPSRWPDLYLDPKKSEQKGSNRLKKRVKKR